MLLKKLQKHTQCNVLVYSDPRPTSQIGCAEYIHGWNGVNGAWNRSWLLSRIFLNVSIKMHAKCQTRYGVRNTGAQQHYTNLVCLIGNSGHCIWRLLEIKDLRNLWPGDTTSKSALLLLDLVNTVVRNFSCKIWQSRTIAMIHADNS
jgi:hypothetical protein